MFRSPISPPSVCTSARSSSRSVISSGESGTEREIFLPGIRSKKHHVALTTIAKQIISTSTRRHEPIDFTLVALRAFHSAHLHLRFGLKFREQLLRNVGKFA